MIIEGNGRTDTVRERADVVVVGTGSGGGTLAATSPSAAGTS
jgi:choline dehydrogenase-like flavoprotein